MNRSPIVLVLLFLPVLVRPAFSHAYFVDSAQGDDANDGRSRRAPWKSLARVNAQIFQPGDELRFKAGTTYRGQLAVQGSGALVDGKPRPIVISVYGNGARPRLDGYGETTDTLLLKNLEFWEVEGLEITNHSPNREPWRTGVRILSQDFGPMRHIVLRNLLVRDVNGDLRKEQEGCGIYFQSKGSKESRFENLRIENCRLLRTDRNGICQRTSNGSRSTGVVIRGNVLEDIGGDGIKVWGSNGALIEHNILKDGRQRCEDYAAGIWPFDSDDTLIQFNEVSGMRGTKDGQGFDADYRCRRTIIQYNYSHENDGGFVLICGPGNSYNENTIIRHNISRNDGIAGARVFHFGGRSTNTRVYGNTIYIGKSQSLPMILCTDWEGGWAEDAHFRGNTFYVEGEVTYDFGQAQRLVFKDNIFYGRHVMQPADPGATTNRVVLPPMRVPQKK